MGVWQVVTFETREIVTFGGEAVTFGGAQVQFYDGSTETVTHDGETVYFCPDGACPPLATGGAAKFGGLSRGMQVIDRESWEEDGIILPLMLDDFP